MTYEDLYSWLIEHIKTRRNKILHLNGKYTSQEKELQLLLSSLANFASLDLAVLEDKTDKNLFYQPGEKL